MNAPTLLETAPQPLPSDAWTLSDTERRADMVRVQAYRLARLRDELRAMDVAGAVLFDPINIRYATGTRNMSNWTSHNLTRWAWVPTEGAIVVYEFSRCEHLADQSPVVAEVRQCRGLEFFTGGDAVEANLTDWAQNVVDFVARDGGGNKRVAVDIAPPMGAVKLAEAGLTVCDGKRPVERARVIKSADELAMMMVAMSVCEKGMHRMRAALEPGITENALWSLLHQTNIEHGGEWIETRLLASGNRSNPWFQECSDRMIRPREMVSYDTDLIGPFGMCVDISRAHFCGPGRPTDEMRRLYQLAYEQIHHNIAVIRPGMSFKEFAERSWQIPESLWDLRYSVAVHGVGMCDEYPAIGHWPEWNERSQDDIIRPGMTLCVESYTGEVGGSFGVKLEEQVLITETGTVTMSNFPYEEELLLREV